MPCKVIKDGPLLQDEKWGATIVCSRGAGAKRVKHCKYCDRPETRLCDFVTVNEPGNYQTCSASLCDKHSYHPGPEQDYCPEHEPIVKAREAAKAR